MKIHVNYLSTFCKLRDIKINTKKVIRAINKL